MATIKLTPTLITLGLCVAPLASVEAQIAQEDPLWEVTFGLQSLYTDNALRSREQEISERQDEANLRVGVDYENTWMTIEGDYSASEHRFDKDSQESQSRLQGQSHLRVGKEQDVADLLISNSRRTELNAPDDKFLLRNTDEREIWSLVPSLRWRTSTANTFMVQGNYSDISYGAGEAKDSDRVGISLLWQRQLSATENLTLGARQTDIEFAIRPDLEYRLNEISLAYETQLRRLGYRIQLGYNEIDSGAAASASVPSYELQLKYQAGVHNFELYADRFLTDNSWGNGNRGDFDGFNPRDSATDELNQLERTNLLMTWHTEIFCTRCSSQLRVFYKDSDYQQELEDQAELGARAQLGYRLSTRSSISLRAQRREQTFDNSGERSDFDLDELRITYQYRSSRGPGWSLFVSYEERDSENVAQNSIETQAGLRLDYRFR